MTEVRPEDHPSRAAYRFALLQSGMEELEVEQKVQEVWSRFRAQVLSSDASEYQSLEHYLNALIVAEVSTSTIEEKIRLARGRWADQQLEQQRSRMASERYEKELLQEEIRLDAAFEVLANRLQVREPDELSEYPPATDQRYQAIRSRIADEHAPDPRYGRLV